MAPEWSRPPGADRRPKNDLTDASGTFVYFAKADDDVIYEFEVDKDVIDLRLLPEAIAFSDLSIVDKEDGSGVCITREALDGSIDLRGITASQLSASNFVLPDGTTPPAHPTGPSVMLGDADGNHLVGRDGPDTVLGWSDCRSARSRARLPWTSTGRTRSRQIGIPTAGCARRCGGGSTRPAP